LIRVYNEESQFPPDPINPPNPPNSINPMHSMNAMNAINAINPIIQHTYLKRKIVGFAPTGGAYPTIFLF